MRCWPVEAALSMLDVCAVGQLPRRLRGDVPIGVTRPRVSCLLLPALPRIIVHVLRAVKASLWRVGELVGGDSYVYRALGGLIMGAGLPTRVHRGVSR